MKKDQKILKSEKGNPYDPTLDQTHKHQKWSITSHFLIILFITSLETAQASTKETKPPVGNFALPSSQQPMNLLGFGQLVLEEGLAQLFAPFARYQGSNAYTTNFFPTGIYGLRDDLSILFSAPVALNDKAGDVRASGLEDLLLQFEYAPYKNETNAFNEHMTIVVNATIPTGSSVEKRLPTGFNSSSFFLGTTFSRIYTEWWAFTSEGVNVGVRSEGRTVGTSVRYEVGVGKNFSSVAEEYIFAGLLEMTGVYTGKTRYSYGTDPHSGGNVIYVTPSLFFSTPKFIGQLGIGFPIVQNLFGEQNKINCLLVSNFAWTF